MTALTADTAHALCKENPPQKLLPRLRISTGVIRFLRLHGHTSPVDRNHSDRLTLLHRLCARTQAPSPRPTLATSDPRANLAAKSTRKLNLLHPGHAPAHPNPHYMSMTAADAPAILHGQLHQGRACPPTSARHSVAIAVVHMGCHSKPTSAKVSLLSRATPMSPMETRLPRGVAATVPRTLIHPCRPSSCIPWPNCQPRPPLADPKRSFAQ